MRSQEEVRSRERVCSCIAFFSKSTFKPQSLFGVQVRDTLAHQQSRQSWQDAVRRYESAIKEGRTSVCGCCGGLWFAQSVKALSKASLLSNNVTEEVIDTVFHMDPDADEDNFCSTCCTAIKHNNILRLCLRNGLEYPAINPKLERLTRLEERLVAPGHIFQTMWPVGRPDGQFRSKVA